MRLHIKKFDHGKDLASPKHATYGSAGVDLLAAIESAVVIAPNSVAIIPTGIAIALDNGFEAQIRPRSGLAAKNAITVLNSPGTIDSDYRGEIKVIIINHGTKDFVVERGMRIAQMVIARYEQVEFVEIESLDETARSEKGFGSTGV